VCKSYARSILLYIVFTGDYKIPLSLSVPSCLNNPPSFVHIERFRVGRRARRRIRIRAERTVTDLRECSRRRRTCTASCRLSTFQFSSWPIFVYQPLLYVCWSSMHEVRAPDVVLNEYYFGETERKQKWELCRERREERTKIY
jgi:hypothetical protein